MSDLALLNSALSNPAPWFAPYLCVARRVLADADSRHVIDALNRHRGESLCDFFFVPHSALPAHESYEAFIARTRCIPTRENLHDVFNALVWLTFPETKRQLNAMQAAEIARSGISNRRGALRDALTLFDENGALLSAPAVLVDTLQRREWMTLFVSDRDAWTSATVVIFGHALLEKLLRPRKGITAHVWVVSDTSDAAIALSLEPDRLAAKLFLPLPVFGVPGWAVENSEPGFYADPAVFRVARLE